MPGVIAHLSLLRSVTLYPAARDIQHICQGQQFVIRYEALPTFNLANGVTFNIDALGLQPGSQIKLCNAVAPPGLKHSPTANITATIIIKYLQMQRPDCAPASSVVRKKGSCKIKS